MPLIMAQPNSEFEIKKISVDDKTKRHLREIGVIEGGKITLISGTPTGVIVVVKEGRLCLYGALARKIIVA